MAIEIPSEWMPNCQVAAIVTHWTGGARTCSDLDRKHYHFIISHAPPKGVWLHRGICSIAANVNLADGSYAAHTRGFNARNGRAVIGVALCGMAGATQSPFNPGGHPITREQWEALADVVAQLAKRYNVPCDDKHILQHGEVQKNLGIKQNGKWDILALPWVPTTSPGMVCDSFRGMVLERLSGKVSTTPQPAKSQEPPQLVLDGKLIGPTFKVKGTTFAPVKALLASQNREIVKYTDNSATTQRVYLRTQGKK